jgi:DNA-3-methyladenine glycosylase
MGGMPRPIKAKAYSSRETVALAHGLVGKLLVAAHADGEVQRRRILEVEAYDGPSDLACHASRGRTARTEVLFGPPGHWYVYLCYGIHEMLNLVTGPTGYPAAILIRSVEGLVGPGRLTRGLGIDRRFNRLPAAPATGLWLEDDGTVPPQIEATPRIGIDYAGPEWAAKPWRFVWSAGIANGQSGGAAKRKTRS